MMPVERFALIEPKHETKKIRFGVFELDTATGELWRDDKAQPRLRDQALQILQMLLEHPRELVTREELRDRLWSSDTFVDFDHGLNTAVNQLRSAFGDSAANPRFIQTVPRRGYRFIAPVEITSSLSPGISAQSPAAGNSATPNRAEILDSQPARSSILSDSHELPFASKTSVRILFSLIQLVYLIFYVFSLARLPQVEATLTASRDLALPILVLLIVTAAIGIPIRLYLLAATAFNYRGLNIKFQKLFPFLLPLDELWALAPFLITHRLGFGLAIAATAALLFLPFSQRSLLLMGFSVKQPSD
jgi:DNA-binding winged helix-turn-helix (wHTH) protein